MAHILQQLSSLRFREIGNLYFSEVQNQVSDRILSSHGAEIKDGTKAHDSTAFYPNNEDDNDIETEKSVLSSASTANVDRGIGTEFVVGRIVSPWFFRDKRVLLPADRGPFSSSYELMMAKTQIQIERIKVLSPLPTDEYHSQINEELAEDQDEILKTCHDSKELIPYYFPALDNSKGINTLYHSDISIRNIIVDPKTYRITGIVDWESVSICPSWETFAYPHFLKGIEVGKPPSLGDPAVDEDALTEIRKDWERVLLRKVYLESMTDAGKGLSGIPLAHETMSDNEIERKQRFATFLYEIELRWEAARHWMPDLRSLVGLESGRVGEDD